jgi:adenosylhomocysteine nucleosidase
MIGIIGAMESETAAIIREMERAEIKELSGIRFVCGTWSGKEIVIATCGVGKVFAALCTEAMILHYHPECIINTGVAGALDSSLKILEVVIADQVVQHDMDTSPLGDPVGMISGINKVELPADPRLVKVLEKAAQSIGVPCVCGVVASGDQFIAEQIKKNLIRSRFKAACCEMEGASIGQVCYVNGVPFAVLRAISDGAGEEAAMDFPVFTKKAARQSINILKEALIHL